MSATAISECCPSDSLSAKESVAPAEKFEQKASQRFLSTQEPEFWAEICHSPAELRTFQADWDALAETALEPNAFYESWLLLNSLETFHKTAQLRLVLIYRKNKRVTDPPILCGLFPLEVINGPFPGIKSLRLLTNIYSYLSTPLLLPMYAQEAWSCLMEWAEQTHFAWVELPRLHAGGAVQQALIDYCYQRQITPFVAEQYNRALLVRGENYEAYQAGNLRGHNRRDMNRLRRRLEEQGQLEYRLLEASSSLDYWIDRFLALEQQGWKGEQGTALNQAEEHAQFFRQVLQQAWNKGKLQMMGMFLNGEPIAMKCNLLSPPGSFAWKIAYDEQFAKFSPGVQLEQENIQVFHDRTPLIWMDSCAVAAHSMINRLWCDRRTIVHLQLPTGTFRGEVYTAVRPLLRYCKRTLLRWRSGKKRSR